MTRVKVSGSRGFLGVEALAGAVWLIACGSSSPAQPDVDREEDDANSAENAADDTAMSDDDTDVSENTADDDTNVSENTADDDVDPSPSSPSTPDTPLDVPVPSDVALEVPPMYGAGTRLKPIVFRHEDVEQHSGLWWDSAAGAACSISKDGTCEFGSYPASVGYRDSRCSEEVIRVRYSACYALLPEWMQPTAAANHAAASTCGDATLYRSTGEIAAGTTMFGEGPVGNCTSTTLQDSDVFYDAEIVTDGLATSTFANEPWGTSLDAHVRYGEDGSWSVEGFYDGNRRWPCAPTSPTYSPSYTCVPEMSESGWYMDDACEVPFAVASGDGCGAEPVVFPIVAALDADCGPRALELYSLAEPTESVQHLGLGATCAPLSDEPVSGFAVGDPIDVATLPRVVPLSSGRGRLQVPYVGVDGVPYHRDRAQGTFFDTENNEACREVFFADGSIHCVPDSFDIQADYALFADATCTGQRLFSRSTGTCSREYRGVVVNVQGCNTVAAEVFSVEPFESDTGYERSAEGTCAPFTISVKTPYYVTTGVIVPADEFAELEAVILE